MNRAETIQILATLSFAFPNAFKGMSKEDAEGRINLWTRLFADNDYQTVSKAVDSLICNREAAWTPSIGEVKAEMAKLNPADRPTPDEAWMMVRKACRNGLYNSQKEFNKLPPAVQSAVGGPWQIKEWANYSDEAMDRVCYTFKKNYKEAEETEIRNEKIPESVKGIASATADRMRLGNGMDL